MTIERTIADHRAMYANDLRIDRLVARQPPTTLDPNTGELHVEPGAATGMPMSGRFLKYLSHPEGYGSDFPWSKAWWHVRSWCRRNHRYHSGPKHWNGSLCHQMVGYVIVRKWSVENAGKILQYDDPEPILRQAFDHIERTMDDYRARAEARERELSGQFSVTDRPAPEHHAVPGLHMQDCPRCKKESAA